MALVTVSVTVEVAPPPTWLEIEERVDKSVRASLLWTEIVGWIGPIGVTDSDPAVALLVMVMVTVAAAARGARRARRKSILNSKLL